MNSADIALRATVYACTLKRTAQQCVIWSTFDLKLGLPCGRY